MSRVPDSFFLSFFLSATGLIAFEGFERYVKAREGL